MKLARIPARLTHAYQNFDHNMKLVEAVKALAEKKGVTTAQLTIDFFGSLGPEVIPLPGSRSVSPLAA